MAIRALTSQEAQIKTATVEVKALMISGKQVTLAVFRQLREEHVIDHETLQLRGLPWGTVNYHHSSDERCSVPHLHVVWQKGDELRHGVEETATSAEPGCIRDFRGRLHQLRLMHHNWHAYLVGMHTPRECRAALDQPGKVDFDKAIRRFLENGGCKPAPIAPVREEENAADEKAATFQHEKAWKRWNLSGNRSYLAMPMSPITPGVRNREAQGRYENDIRAYDASVGLRDEAARTIEGYRERGFGDIEGIRSAIDETERLLKAALDHYQALVAQLSALDQLFIAV